MTIVTHRNLDVVSWLNPQLLGFFNAKTLLERSGATLSFANRGLPERGAIIRLRWDRTEFERTLNFAGA